MVDKFECLRITLLAISIGVPGVTLLDVVRVHLQWAAMRSDQYPKAIDLLAIRETLFTASRKYLAEVESRLGPEGIKVITKSIEGDRAAHASTDYA